MAGKGVLTATEKTEIRVQRRAKEVAHPGAQFFIHVADETDDNGEPLVDLSFTTRPRPQRPRDFFVVSGCSCRPLNKETRAQYLSCSRRELLKEGRAACAKKEGACKVVGACQYLNAKLRVFGKETALWGSWFGG